eukprot:TRINITY_DN17482_c0_g2_i2.p1 TRINITY_DN17482_c0_g2~~TRINITY_DN17482_c0_g2_i2.p1  ORF type:complete len:382 (+),score=31.76 TRINITY_DN17482_c0_g2_i2:274-1419(+)
MKNCCFMKIKLDVQGLTYSQTQNNAYALILRETNGTRRLPIIIGGFEAQSIAIQIEKIKYSRPLTHDLFKNFADTFGIQVTEVIIYKLEEGVFYSQLISNNGKDIHEIEARTSDAVSLALRFNCPIYTYEQIMKDAAIDESNLFTPDEATETELSLPDEADNEYEYYTFEELNKMLNEAVRDENYEQASKIRDEIERRKNQQKKSNSSALVFTTFAEIQLLMADLNDSLSTNQIKSFPYLDLPANTKDDSIKQSMLPKNIFYFYDTTYSYSENDTTYTTSLFQNHLLKPKSSCKRLIQSNNNDWLLIPLLIIVILYIYISTNFHQRWIQTIKAPFSSRFLGQLERDGNIFNETILFPMFFIEIISISLCLLYTSPSPRDQA